MYEIANIAWAKKADHVCTLHQSRSSCQLFSRGKNLNLTFPLLSNGVGLGKSCWRWTSMINHTRKTMLFAEIDEFRSMHCKQYSPSHTLWGSLKVRLWEGVKFRASTIQTHCVLCTGRIVLVVTRIGSHQCREILLSFFWHSWCLSINI